MMKKFVCFLMVAASFCLGYPSAVMAQENSLATHNEAYIGAGDIHLTNYIKKNYLYLGRYNIPSSIVKRNETWKLIRAIAIYLQNAGLKPSSIYIDTALISDSNFEKLWPIMNESGMLSGAKVLSLTNLDQAKINTMLSNISALSSVLITNLSGKNYDPTALVKQLLSSNPSYLGGIFRGYPLSKKMLDLYHQNTQLAVLGGDVNQQSAGQVIQWLKANPDRLQKFYPAFNADIKGSTIKSVMQAASSQTNLHRLLVSIANPDSFSLAAGQGVAKLITELPKLSLFILTGPVSDQGLTPLAKALSTYSSLGSITLGFSQVDFSNHDKWLAGILGNVVVNKLIMRNAGLDDSEMPAISSAVKQRLLPLVLDLVQNKISNIQDFSALLKSGMLPALVVSDAYLSSQQLDKMDSAGIPILTSGPDKPVILGIDASIIAQFPGYYFSGGNKRELTFPTSGLFGVINSWYGQNQKGIATELDQSLKQSDSSTQDGGLTTFLD
jgi:hypothetical protein